MERFKTRGILTQVEGHVGVRDARQHARLLGECGFVDVRVTYLAHYLYVASLFHWLGYLPIVGSWFRARLFISCRKAP
jgi:hypothetical protein